MAESKSEEPPSPRPEADRSPVRRRLVLAGIGWAFLLVLIDQISKIVVERVLANGQVIEVIPGVFELRLARNTGAAWGMLSGYGLLLTLVGVAVVALALCFIRYLTEGHIERYIAVFTIVGGVVGNSIDRLWRNHVVDFFAVDLQFYHWPIFNVADCAIVGGVILFLISVLLRSDRRGKNRNAARDDAAG